MKEYTVSALNIFRDMGIEPVPTIYNDSNGDTIYVSSQPVVGYGDLVYAKLEHGMQSMGILTYKTTLNDNELA